MLLLIGIDKTRADGSPLNSNGIAEVERGLLLQTLMVRCILEKRERHVLYRCQLVFPLFANSPDAKNASCLLCQEMDR